MFVLCYLKFDLNILSILFFVDMDYFDLALIRDTKSYPMVKGIVMWTGWSS